jgi:hypothetical protein
MDHFAGLDVSVKATSVCIVDDTGKVVREVKVTSEPEALLAVLMIVIDPIFMVSAGSLKRDDVMYPGSKQSASCRMKP